MTQILDLTAKISKCVRGLGLGAVILSLIYIAYTYDHARNCNSLNCRISALKNGSDLAPMRHDCNIPSVTPPPTHRGRRLTPSCLEKKDLKKQQMLNGRLKQNHYKVPAKRDIVSNKIKLNTGNFSD